MNTAVGIYSLVLESFDSNASSPQEALKIDTVTIYVTEYFRTESFARQIVITKGNQATLNVQHASSLITLPTSPKVNLRQKNDISQAFVIITNG